MRRCGVVDAAVDLLDRTFETRIAERIRSWRERRDWRVERAAVRGHSGGLVTDFAIERMLERIEGTNVKRFTCADLVQDADTWGRSDATRRGTA